MLDLRLIRREPDLVRAGLTRRGDALDALDRVITLDETQRDLGRQRDELRAKVKELSGQVGRLHRDGRADEAAAIQVESRVVGEEERALTAEADAIAAEIRDLLLRINNLPADDVPDGLSEADNPVVRTVGPMVDAFGPEQRAVLVAERRRQA